MSGTPGPGGEALRARLEQALGTSFTLERELSGGMSRVFVAREIALGRDVVIKVLPPEMAAAVSLERFRREVQLVARLRHPHIVPLLAAGDADGVPYYTMPLVAGESLRARLSRGGALPVSEAVRLLREVADALAYAHAERLVHRDLKPENILLEHGHALVADFGVAKALARAATSTSAHGTSDELTSVGMAIGTPAYMAPEQALADPAADHRVDLYALGCVAYELLAGAPPFGTRTPQAMIAAHIAETPAPLAERRANLPRELSVLVMRLLEKRAEDRPSSAAEVVGMLDAIDTHSSLRPSVVRNGSTTRARRALRSRPAWIVAGVLASVALVAAGWRVLAHSQMQATAPQSANVASVASRTATVTSPGVTSVAVLPLVNVGGDTAQEYFADGMTDELTGALGKVRGVRVASRTSAYAFKGQRDVDVREIGRRLNVDAVLEGTIRRAGGRLRVGAQLTSVRDGLTLWSDSYERRVADVFAMQEEIARAITGALEQHLRRGPIGDVAPAQQYDLAAYDMFLQAEFFYRKHTEKSLRRSIELYEAAARRDPALASRAWLGVSDAWAWLADDWVAPVEAWPKARSAAQHAIAADSTFDAVSSSQGVVLLLYDHDFAGAERVMRRAIGRDSMSSGNHYDLAELMMFTGRLDSATVLMRRAGQLDPLDPQIMTRLGDILSFAGRSEEAHAQYRAALALEPDYSFALIGMATLLTSEGRAAEALRALDRAPEQTVRVQVLRALAFASLGRRADALRIAHELESARQRRYVFADGIASIYAALGDREGSFRWLDVAVAERAGGLLYLRLRPWWKPLYGDPRWTALVRQTLGGSGAERRS